MRPGIVPRFSRLTMYAPPPFGYARTVCRYDETTIAMSAAIASAIGMTRPYTTTLAPSRTVRISSVAYATEDSASEEKTGSARILGSSVCSRCPLATARPTRTRLTIPPPEVARGMVVFAITQMLRGRDPSIPDARLREDQPR